MEKKQIKIFGVPYTIVKTSITGLAGECNFNDQLIHISIKVSGKEEQESTVLHEIIEAINYKCQLELTHQTICTLESALYHIIKDNPEFFLGVIEND